MDKKVTFSTVYIKTFHSNNKSEEYERNILDEQDELYDVQLHVLLLDEYRQMYIEKNINKTHKICKNMLIEYLDTIRNNEYLFTLNDIPFPQNIIYYICKIREIMNCYKKYIMTLILLNKKFNRNDVICLLFMLFQICEMDLNNLNFHDSDCKSYLKIKSILDDLYIFFDKRFFDSILNDDIVYSTISKTVVFYLEKIL